MTDWSLLAVTFFSGGVAGYALSELTAWWRRPQVVIEFGEGYPFVDTATFMGGGTGDFVWVRVKNNGRGKAERCKCYLRNVKLIAGGKVVQLPTASLMLTSWVPRETNTRIKTLPAKSEFFADVAFAHKEGGPLIVEPIFEIQNANVSAFAHHIGEFELEFVVVGENFVPVSDIIKFSFDGSSTTLKAMS